MLKNKIIVGAFVFALAIVGFGFNANSAEAATCTAEATGLWSATATWDAACNTNTIPDADDTVIIPGNFIVTVDAAGAVAGTVSVSNPIGTGNNGITIASPGTLVVAGTVTIVGSSGASHSTIAVANGSLTAAGISITGGGSTGNSVLSVSTGSITSSAGITLAGVQARAQITATGAATITLSGTTGTMSANGIGIVTLNSASTVVFSGTGAQTVSTATYGNVTINKASGTASAESGGTVGIAGILTITSGTFDTADNSFSVTGATNIASGGTLVISSIPGSRQFTGNVTNDGTWTETAAEDVLFSGNLTNNGTFTASTGVHTFNGTGKVISGTVSIPNLTISGTTSNTDTLTVSTALAGASTLTNSATGALNIGGTSTITGLTATAVGNRVYYTGTAQTVKAVSYDDLDLEGSGVKTIGSGITIAGDLSIDTGVVADLTGDSTANRLLLEGELQVAGSTGATGSSASNINNVYFSGTGKVTSASGTEVVSSSSGSGGGGRSNKPKTPATPTAVNCAAGQMFSATTGAKCTQTVSSNDVSCPSGQMFDGVTGKKCTTWAGSSASGYAFGTTLVKSGTKGESCKAWQMFLNAKANAGLATDGWCGAKTITAAKAWQASVGLTADGVLGAMSRAKAQ